MKKIFVLLGLLISVIATAQPGYTTINARYNWLAGRFQALHVPGFNTTPSLQTGQWPGDGAIGIDTVLNKFFFYSSGVWTQAGGSFYDSTLMASVKRLKDTASAIRADIAGAVPGIDAVIASDPSLTASRTIDGGGFGLNFGITNTFTTTLQTVDFGTQATILLSPGGSHMKNVNSGTSAYGDLETGDGKSVMAAFDGSGTPDSIMITANNARIAVNGVFQIKDASLAGSTVGDVWTITNTTTGAGEWAAGGGGTTLYSGDGALAGNRVVDLGGNSLDFQQGGDSYFLIASASQQVIIRPQDGTGFSDLTMKGGGLGYSFNLQANDGTNTVSVVGDAGVPSITYTADLHSFLTGIIRGDALHNNAFAQGDATEQDVRSGTYTPTLTNVTNVAASTAYACQWIRVGNVVTVSGKVDIDVTLGAASELGMSLPITSDMAAEENLGGTASSAAAASLVSAIKADATNDRAAFVFTAISLTNDSYAFEFTYLVL